MTRIGEIETYTTDRESYEAILRCSDAKRLPVSGLIKSYVGTEFDDFGKSVRVFIRSTERPNAAGQITWSQAAIVS